VPIRDLLLSPAHCIAAEDASGRRGVVPAGRLVNGATIRREPAAGPLAFIQPATAEHELLMADGMAAESCRDAGMPPSAPPLRPLAAAAWGDVHARLLERALACGHRLTADPGLAVLCGEAAAEPILAGDGEHVFLLPPGAGAVRLRSRAFVPADTDPQGGDQRRLGVAVARIVHDGLEIDLDGPACAAGFLPAEGEAALRWRWTTGEALLALPALAHDSVLELRLGAGWSRYWLAP
jgi:hypothetical protein